MEWAWAIGIAAICAAIEALLSGPRPFTVLGALRQPAWALPSWGWMIVGGLFYAIFVFALGRMLALDQVGAAALIVVVLLTDGVWNLFLFRLRRFDWAYRYLFPYALLVLASAWLCWQHDPLAGLAIVPYILFLPYDFAWTQALRALNQR